MVKDHSDSERGIPWATVLIWVGEPFSCPYPLKVRAISFQLAAKDLLYGPSHRKDTSYLGLCYTSCRALAGMFV